MVRRKHPILPERADYYPAAVASLRTRGGSATIEELEEDVAAQLNLSDEARSIPHGDGRQSQFQYDLAWVRTYLKWAGAVENSERGVWRLTPVGAAMTDEELRGLWRKIVADQRRRRKDPSGIDAEEDDVAEAVPAATPQQERDLLEISWKERLLDVLMSMDPAAFERLCQRLLREAGFTKVEITGRSGDGGIDGVGVLRMNLLSFHVLFQCKRFRDSVSSPIVRNFRGAMVGRADKGLIITTGTFTADARREATRDGAPAIDLIDGDTLCDLLKQTKVGVTVTYVEQVVVDAEAILSI